MILNPTIIPNTNRTITGLLNFVFNGDTFITCNTTSGAVAITLMELTPGYLNTVYKLYIIDSGNASVNNITINAPIGYTINGQASLTINVNFGICVITISSDTSYLATLSYSISGSAVEVDNEQSPLVPPVVLTTALSKLKIQGFQSTVSGNDVTMFNSFITLTFAQLQTLATGNDLITNQGYNISNAIYGSQTANVYLLGTSQNTIGNSGLGLFFNADYQNVGNYSGIPGFASQLGIWGATLVPVINSVCIWDNKHFRNTTGANGVNNPSLDAVNWTPLSLSATNGYIISIDSIIYDSSSNLIFSRSDAQGNTITNLKIGALYSLNLFKWGAVEVSKNQTFNSLFYNCNSVFSTSCFNNQLTNSRIILGDQINIGGSFDTFNNNSFENNFSSNLSFGNVISNNTTNINDNLINDSSGSINGIGNFEKNVINNSSLIIENNFTFSQNSINQSTIILVNSASGRIFSNYFSVAQISILINDAIISNNTIDNSSINVTNSNTGDINFNNLSLSSIIQLQNNLAPGQLSYNTLVNESSIIIQNNNNNVGNNNESNFLSNSSIQLGTNNADIVKNSLFDSQIQIATNNGVFVTNFIQNSTLIRCDINNGNFQNLILGFATFGSLTYTNISNYNFGVFQKGNLSIDVLLDCSDPAIYDLPTTTLTIPIELKEFGGIFRLGNANGLTITNIINTSDSGEQTFFNSPGETTTFVTTSVGAIVPAGELVSSLSPTPYNIILIGRLAGSDEFKSVKKSNVNQITEVNIFV